jgi:hypothetical protein
VKGGVDVPNARRTISHREAIKLITTKTPKFHRFGRLVRMSKNLEGQFAERKIFCDTDTGSPKLYGCD